MALEGFNCGLGLGTKLPIGCSVQGKGSGQGTKEVWALRVMSHEGSTGISEISIKFVRVLPIKC